MIMRRCRMMRPLSTATSAITSTTAASAFTAAWNGGRNDEAHAIRQRDFHPPHQTDESEHGGC